MPNNVPPLGDDQKWKKEVDRALADLIRRLQILEEKVKVR